MKKILFLLLVSAGALFTCARPENRVTIVLDWSVNTNHTGIYAARELGYFRDQGLEVNIEFPPETGAAGMVLAGQADFFVSYQEEITYARAAGKDLVALAAVIQHNTSGFASRKEEGIIRPRDFEGRKYGGWGSPMEEAVLKALMKRDGGDYGKIENISVGSMDFFAATDNRIDFTWIFEGWDGVMAKLKGIEINYIPLSKIEEALDYYTPVIAATGKYIEEHPGIVSGFMQAVSGGYAYAAAEPGKAAEILLKNAPELDRDLVRASQKFLAPRYRADAPYWGHMELSVWENFSRWMKQYGLLDAELDVRAAFTNDFLPR